jgi:hypothetical protein
MRRYFMQSWKSHLCDEYERQGDEGWPLCETSSAKFSQLGVKKGDQIYAVFVRDGKLFLVGKMEVERPASSWKEVVDLLGQENVYRGVRGAQYLIAKRATQMCFSQQLPLSAVKKLRFASRENPRPKFVDSERLDRQTLRNVRELTQESATLLSDLLKYKKMKLVKLNA